MLPRMPLIPLLVLMLLALSACNASSRLSEVGKEPELAVIENPAQAPAVRTVSMPMPNIEEPQYAANSLWRAGARGFFKDQRAKQIGDILTINIDIQDQASLSNSSSRARDNSEEAAVPAFGGFEGRLGKILPDGVDPTDLIDFTSTTANSGSGQIDRTENISLSVAAVIVDRLPNGNLVVHGKQQVRVNYELRELQLSGIIRPQDIGNANTIPFDKVAEARMSYGGRGHISDVQQARYGQQVFDIIFPF